MKKYSGISTLTVSGTACYSTPLIKREARKKKWKFLPYWDISDVAMADTPPPQK